MENTTAPITILISPITDFTHLSQAFKDLGLQRDPDRSAVAAGEPEFASWSQDYRAELDYYYDPVSGLRWVALRGERARELAQALSHRLPTLDLQRVKSLLESSDKTEILLGLQAAAALGDPSLAEDLARLESSPDPEIASRVSQAWQALASRMAEKGRQTRRLQAQRYARGHALIEPGSPQERRQALRLILQGMPAGRTRAGSAQAASAEAVLRAALEDADWEMRATALFGVARLPAPGLRDLVRRIRLPQSSQEEPDPRRRKLLQAFPPTVLALLDGQRPPDDLERAPSDVAELRGHLLRLVSGLPVRAVESAALLCTSLTEPLPLLPPTPPSLPPFLVPHDGFYYQAELDMEFVWVPALAHWLGDDLPPHVLPNPIRRVAPISGFFIARLPFALDDAKEQAAAYPQFSYAQALDLCRRLSQGSPARLRLPSADEWEMAARGPDGRRYPWGNAVQATVEPVPSPWGLLNACGVIGQWAVAGGQAVICGQALPCAARQLGEQAAVRLALEA